jgi:hypothetical protein
MKIYPILNARWSRWTFDRSKETRVNGLKSSRHRLNYLTLFALYNVWSKLLGHLRKEKALMKNMFIDYWWYQYCSWLQIPYSFTSMTLEYISNSFLTFSVRPRNELSNCQRDRNFSTQQFYWLIFSLMFHSLYILLSAVIKCTLSLIKYKAGVSKKQIALTFIIIQILIINFTFTVIGFVEQGIT